VDEQGLTWNGLPKDVLKTEEYKAKAKAKMTQRQRRRLLHISAYDGNTVVFLINIQW
jgi:hypothetical protein